MASVFDYIFNIGGNFTAQINGMSQAAGDFSARIETTRSKVDGFTAALARFDLIKSTVQGVADGIGQLSASGIRLDAQMHDLSAVAGVTGEGLKQIEAFARESAKAFGTDASVAVEGYKLLLSQLSPELGKYPEALRAMGDNIQTTSKLMGGDGVAAAQVLTTAMNQYGVSMEDPTAASAEMARMMNVMAAAGQAGSAELPAISAALQQCGMAAKAANVSFEETNAAIQVLDKAGKKASEGGVALRNVLGMLGRGRFIEKQAREELAAAGIDVEKLADTSKGLKERLEMLKPLLGDSALLSKFFGTENANAALALIQGTDSLGDFTEAVTGTTSAVDQAAVIMDSYAERQALTISLLKNYSFKDNFINCQAADKYGEMPELSQGSVLDIMPYISMPNLFKKEVEPETGEAEAYKGGWERITDSLRMPYLQVKYDEMLEPHINVKGYTPQLSTRHKRYTKRNETEPRWLEPKQKWREQEMIDIGYNENVRLADYIRRDEIKETIETTLLGMLR